MNTKSHPSFKQAAKLSDIQKYRGTKSLGLLILKRCKEFVSQPAPVQTKLF